MKLRFENDLPFQLQAISSVVDLFRGQTPMQSNFTVANIDQVAGQTGMEYTEHGVGNKLELDEDEICENLQEIQLRNGLAQTMQLKPNQYDFDVEMETGTGKTYVYTRTILELNKQYGFSKFIIVVPSLAIKEGVYKSLQITESDLKLLYENRVYDYFIYNSDKLEQVRNFAVSDNIQIMIINIDAFRRSFDDIDKESKANIIHRQNDKLNGMKPIELIRETRPFVIIDEPQSVDTTPKSQEAIKSLNPLCTLRYSATHVKKHNQVYKLDAVDAYDLGLVKQIEVAAFESRDYHNNAYMKLLSVDNRKPPITAKIEVDAMTASGPKRKIVTVRTGDDLASSRLTGRDIYEGYIINEIYCEKGNEYVDFTSKRDVLRIGAALGDIDDMAVKRQQIRKTIEEHLNKELMFKQTKRGIKVLSLFFIDKVANYRIYDDDGNRQNGIYANIFEEEYADVVSRPKYQTLFGSIDAETPAADVHDGYFSTDKKKGNKEVYKDTNGSTAADDIAYNLIMRDKEKLLSLDTKLRFIFSHSALREGWDNPNVFQICTLNETRSEVKKRQEIGRGLRLCVNQDGERVRGFETNTLTVMANESYESFAKALQKEIEQEEGIRFGVIESHTFANIPVKQSDGTTVYLGQNASEQIVKHFMDKGYIDGDGKVTDILRRDIKNNAVELPDAYTDVSDSIAGLAKKLCGGLNIKNNNDKRPVRLKQGVLDEPMFKELWDRIKYKTTYSVNYDSEKLIDKSVDALQTSLFIESSKLVYTKADVDITAGGVTATERERVAVAATNVNEALPDIISYLQNGTDLTRKTIAEILVRSKTLDLFKRNPQKYMDEALKLISSQMRLLIVDGIKYTKIGNDTFYAQELFQTEELFGYLSKNMLKSEKSVYEYVVYDSENEATFAQKFEENNHVKLYCKLPDWFKIPTPLGSYNPDWAVLIEEDDKERLYFVIETKGSILAESLRQLEDDKIKCGRKHFEALGAEAVYMPLGANDFESFIESAYSRAERWNAASI